MRPQPPRDTRVTTRPIYWQGTKKKRGGGKRAHASGAPLFPVLSISAKSHFSCGGAHAAHICVWLPILVFFLHNTCRPTSWQAGKKDAPQDDAVVCRALLFFSVSWMSPFPVSLWRHLLMQPHASKGDTQEKKRARSPPTRKKPREKREKKDKKKMVAHGASASYWLLSSFFLPYKNNRVHENPAKGGKRSGRASGWCTRVIIEHIKEGKFAHGDAQTRDKGMFGDAPALARSAFAHQFKQFTLFLHAQCAHRRHDA